MDRLVNINVAAEEVLITPQGLKQQLPLSDKGAQTVGLARTAIQGIIDRQDHRLIVIVGPCSIHDMAAAKAYAQLLKSLQAKVQDSLLLVMRVYFEKPRTSTGWKGFINDPDLNDSFHLDKGLHLSRALLIWLAEQGIPTATEALDPIMPQYLSDLFCWTAIGARTSESQTHREMASGLSTPVGFKNATDGELAVVINGLKSASTPHHFLGINQAGQVTILRTTGNRYGHLVLRGGLQPNYDAVSIALSENALQQAGLASNIIIDCNHGNSDKKPERQPMIAKDIAHQIIAGNQSIIGLMLESHINGGNQNIPLDLSQLKYGVSVTDACLDWSGTEQLINEMHASLGSILFERLKR